MQPAHSGSEWSLQQTLTVIYSEVWGKDPGKLLTPNPPSVPMRLFQCCLQSNTGKQNALKSGCMRATKGLQLLFTGIIYNLKLMEFVLLSVIFKKNELVRIIYLGNPPR